MERQHTKSSNISAFIQMEQTKSTKFNIFLFNWQTIAINPKILYKKPSCITLKPFNIYLLAKTLTKFYANIQLERCGEKEFLDICSALLGYGPRCYVRPSKSPCFTFPIVYVVASRGQLIN